MPLLPTTFPSFYIKYYILYSSKRWAWLCDLCFYCFYKSNSQFSTTVSFSRQQHGFEFRKLVFWGDQLPIPFTRPPCHPWHLADAHKRTQIFNKMFALSSIAIFSVWIRTNIFQNLKHLSMDSWQWNGINKCISLHIMYTINTSITHVHALIVHFHVVLWEIATL